MYHLDESLIITLPFTPTLITSWNPSGLRRLYVLLKLYCCFGQPCSISMHTDVWHCQDPENVWGQDPLFITEIGSMIQCFWFHHNNHQVRWSCLHRSKAGNPWPCLKILCWSSKAFLCCHDLNDIRNSHMYLQISNQADAWGDSSSLRFSTPLLLSYLLPPADISTLTYISHSSILILSIILSSLTPQPSSYHPSIPHPFIPLSLNFNPRPSIHPSSIFEALFLPFLSSIKPF